MLKSKVITLAFEGMHRVGKGTQMGLLAKHLDQFGVPHIEIKGDGSRSGTGTDLGNPQSEWWVVQNQKLRKTGGAKENFAEWDKAAHRLVRELSIWKGRVLPKLMRGNPAHVGLLLVDRSIISRTSFTKFKLSSLVDLRVLRGEDLYPDISQDKINNAMPDIIIELTAPKETLLSRLESNDPKYKFRLRMIEKMFDNYATAKVHLPDEILQRVVPVNSTNPPKEVFREILKHLSQRFPELIFLTANQQIRP